MPIFEVGVYNQNVRELVADGNTHKNLDDDWSDVHYFEIKAMSEEAAKAKIAAKYPASKGYIIDYLQELEED